MESMHTLSAQAEESAIVTVVSVSASLDMREEDVEDRLARTTALDTAVACTTTRSILQ